MQVAIVLVAEDDESIVDLLTQSLEDGGFAVIAAPSGGAAVAAISAAEDLQALVTDVRMGSGPDGWEVAHFARHRFPDVAVIYISGDSAQEWTEKGVPRSIMIEKPFAPAQVVTGISTLLNKTD